MTVKYIVYLSTILYHIGTDCAVPVLLAVPSEAMAEEGCPSVWAGSCVHALSIFEQVLLCPEGCRAHPGVHLAHAKLGLK